MTAPSGRRRAPRARPRTRLLRLLRHVRRSYGAVVHSLTGLPDRGPSGVLTAVAAVVVAVLVLAGLGAGRVVRDQGVAAPTEPTAAPTPVDVALPGTWLPRRVAGAAVASSGPRGPRLVIGPGRTWSGSDGCAPVRGTFDVRADGRFLAIAEPLAGATPADPAAQAGGSPACTPVPVAATLTGTGSVSVRGDVLTLLDDSGKELAVLQRVPPPAPPEKTASARSSTTATASPPTTGERASTPTATTGEGGDVQPVAPWTLRVQREGLALITVGATTCSSYLRTDVETVPGGLRLTARLRAPAPGCTPRPVPVEAVVLLPRVPRGGEALLGACRPSPSTPAGRACLALSPDA